MWHIMLALIMATCASSLQPHLSLKAPSLLPPCNHNNRTAQHSMAGLRAGCQRRVHMSLVPMCCHCRECERHNNAGLCD